jgi:hypothetical protein
MLLVLSDRSGHPLDTIKVRLQTQSNYRGAMDCFLKVVKNEGVHSLYRGIGSPLASLTILNMLYVWLLVFPLLSH